MRKRSKDSVDKPDFSTLIPGYPDAEITGILKKRNHYQPEAADLAVKEAIKRGIIHSEQDLFSEEFRVEPLKRTFFPAIESEIQQKKISKSIGRGLIISGAIPLIYGVILLFEGDFAEGIVLTVGGILWLVLAFQLFRQVKRRTVNLFFILIVISVIYLVNFFVAKKTFVVMDFFIPLVFYAFVIYGLIFLKKINP